MGEEGGKGKREREKGGKGKGERGEDISSDKKNRIATRGAVERKGTYEETQDQRYNFGRRRPGEAFVENDGRDCAQVRVSTTHKRAEGEGTH